MFVADHIKIGTEHQCSVNSVVHLSQYIAERVVMWW